MTALAMHMPDRRRLMAMSIPFAAVIGSMAIGLLLIAVIVTSVVLCAHQNWTVTVCGSRLGAMEINNRGHCPHRNYTLVIPLFNALTTLKKLQSI